jgi:hypothetical protein
VSESPPPSTMPLPLVPELQRGRHPALGACLLGATLLYAAAIHHGVAPSREHAHWWQPPGFLFEFDIVNGWSELPGVGILALTLPCALLALAVIATTRSSCARGLAIAATATVALFAFYAFVGRQAWEFFSWRGTLVLMSTGGVVGFALAAPWLAASWLRQRPGLAFLLYLPVLLGTVALMRHVTGTNESMPFNVSPWPAFSVLGLDIGVYTIAGVQLGVAVGLVARAVVGYSRTAALALAAVAPCLPVLWFLLRHPHPGAVVLIAIGGTTLLFVLVVALLAAQRTDLLLRRAFLLGLGAALALLPVVAGQSLAAGDFAVSRFVRAQALIDALAGHYEQEGIYPDALEELVEGGAIGAIPRPRVGFAGLYAIGWLDPIEFRYQNLGSGFILEFEATDWVQCAYSPPWSEDEEDLDEGEQPLEVEEAWSCPDGRPELW